MTDEPTPDPIRRALDAITEGDPAGVLRDIAGEMHVYGWQTASGDLGAVANSIDVAVKALAEAQAERERLRQYLAEADEATKKLTALVIEGTEERERLRAALLDLAGGAGDGPCWCPFIWRANEDTHTDACTVARAMTKGG